MRILLVASVYKSMTQRMHAELTGRGHEVPVESALGDEIMREGVRRYDPDHAIAPMLTTAILDMWSSWPCLPAVSPASALRSGLVDRSSPATRPTTARRWRPWPSSWPPAPAIRRG